MCRLDENMAGCDPKNCEILITAVGNPNVDKTVEVADVSIFTKHNLCFDGHRPVSTEVLKTINEDIKRYKNFNRKLKSCE